MTVTITTTPRTLRNGVANTITVRLKKDGVAVPGKTVAFYIVLWSDNIDTGPKIGTTTFPTTEDPDEPGAYIGSLPYANSLDLLTNKLYRIVPTVSGEYRGGGTQAKVIYA